MSAGESLVSEIEAGHCLGLSVRDADGRRQIRNRSVIEVLEEDTDVAAIELASQIGFELTAFLGRVACRADAFASSKEAADVKGPVVDDGTSVLKIHAGGVEVNATSDAHFSSFYISGAGNEVDDRSRGIRGKRRGGATSDRFNAEYRCVEAKEVVRVTEGDVAEGHDGQAIFLQLNILGAARGDREASHLDVCVVFAA